MAGIVADLVDHADLVADLVVKRYNLTQKKNKHVCLFLFFLLFFYMFIMILVRILVRHEMIIHGNDRIRIDEVGLV